MKRILCILLSLIMAASTFAACSSDKEGDTVTTAAPVETTAAETTAPEETRLYADHLPDMEFDGEVYRNAHFDTTMVLIYDDMVTEDKGDLISGATYKRNLAVEEKLGIKIENTYIPLEQIPAEYRKMVNSSEDIYDSVFVMGINLPELYSGKLLTNLYSMPYIDWTSPWWDQASIRGLSIDGMLPAVASDLTLCDKTGTACVMFNKKVAVDNKISPDDLYQYAIDGVWTFDKMYEISRDISNDLNGNGEQDAYDMYGMVGNQDTTYMLFYASGERIVKNNSDGIPEIAFSNERSYSVCQYIIDLMADRKNYGTFANISEQAYILDALTQNHALFMIHMLFCTDLLRNMEADYGVIPVPKYDETQDAYYSAVSRYADSSLTIPKTNSRHDFTAIVLELLACESRYTLRDAYYNVVLQEKLTRDAASYQMMDYVFANRVYDIGEFFGIGGFNNVLLQMGTNVNMSSKFASMSSRMEKDLNKFIKTAEEMNE